MINDVREALLNIQQSLGNVYSMNVEMRGAGDTILGWDAPPVGSFLEVVI